jgi:hypothetical protein
MLDGVSAGSNQTSAAEDTSVYPRVSFHVIWSGLTGTIDGTVKLQVSNTGGDWVDKTGASVTLSGAAGADMISLNGVATEFYYRVVYTKNNITAGSITVVAAAKAA